MNSVDHLVSRGIYSGIKDSIWSKKLANHIDSNIFYKETITHNTKAQIFCTEFLLSMATFRSDVIEMNLIRMFLLESLIKYSL